MTSDIPTDALIGLTIHRADVETQELRRLTRTMPLSSEDKADVRDIIRTLSEIVGVEQMEAA